MSDREESEDIEGDEPVSTDGSDTEGSLKDFIASEDHEGDSPSTDEDSSDEVQPELILTGKRKRTVRVSDSPEISTDSDDPDYEPGDCK